MGQGLGEIKHNKGGFNCICYVLFLKLAGGYTGLCYIIIYSFLYAWTISCLKNLKNKSEGTNPASASPSPSSQKNTRVYPCVWCKTLCKNFEMLSHVDRNGKTSLVCSLCCTTSYKVKQVVSGKVESRLLWEHCWPSLPSFKTIPVAWSQPQLSSCGFSVPFLHYFTPLCALFFSLSLSLCFCLCLCLSLPAPALPDPVASAAVGFLTLLTTSRSYSLSVLQPRGWPELQVLQALHQGWRTW